MYPSWVTLRCSCSGGGPHAAGKSELTVKTYVQTLTKFNAWLLENGGDINNLTRRDVQSYINYLDADGKSASTINKTFAALSVFARYVERLDIVDNIRVPEFRKAKNVAPKSLDRNEKNRLLREIERSGNLRDIAIGLCAAAYRNPSIRVVCIECGRC
jgi:integrase/recombinase XerD